MKTIKQYLLYILRWQLGTPILAVIMDLDILQQLTSFWIVFFANLVGALLFFWVDKFIFSRK